MAGVYTGYTYTKEAVRVKVKKCEPNLPSEWRKFSVDPQITSLEVLYSILAKAFDIKSDFSINYKAIDPSGHESYLAVLSDWDLDAAFLRTHNLSVQNATEPCLLLQVDIKPFTEVKEWDPDTQSSGGNSINRDMIAPLQQSIGMSQKYVQNMQTKLPGLIMNQMEKTLSIVQKALNLNDDPISSLPPRPPLSDNEFRNFLDSVGQILQQEELKKVIFLGGIDPSLRRVVWKHIMNVYPSGMTGRQRMDYMKNKAAYYYRLRDSWKTAVQKGPVIGELSYVTSMVKKDVLRTDRLHPFYAGSDDNQNIAALFNILTTYALNHPSVSYCQGMSDIASPLLVTMNDEAHAYICFCAIMSRLKVNFMLDGIAMTQKFTHLAEAINYYDSEFYDYLKSQQADDLLFCYRWLLLELKREFPFEDSLRMLEVQWSSLSHEALSSELALVEQEFELPPPMDEPPPKSPSYLLKPRENHYTKVCALRRQSSLASLNSASQQQFNLNCKLDTTKRLNQSMDENIARRSLRNRKVAKSHQSLDEAKMLMLMESVEANRVQEHNEHETEIPNPNNCNEINDYNTETNSNTNEIVFHPTNPFIDDAQMNSHGHYQDIDTKKLSSVFGESEDDISRQSIIDKVIKTKNEIIDIKAKLDFDNISRDINKMTSKLTNNNPSNKITQHLINSTRKGGHFKELKEKIGANKISAFTSMDKLDKTSSQMTSPTKHNDLQKIEKSQRKLVKNLNEFQNLTSKNKRRTVEKVENNNLQHQENNKTFDLQQQPPHPSIKLTKRISSLDESDSSNADSDIVMNGYHPKAIYERPFSLNLTKSVADNYQTTFLTDDNTTPEELQNQEYYPVTTSMTRELRLELEYLDRQVFGTSQTDLIKLKQLTNPDSDIEYKKLDKDSLDLMDDLKENEIVSCPDINDLLIRRKAGDNKIDCADKRLSTASSTNNEIFIWENPLHNGLNISPGCFFEDNGGDRDNDIQRSVLDKEHNVELTYSEPLKDDSDSENLEENWKCSDNLNPFLKSAINEHSDDTKNYLNDPALVMQSPSSIPEESISTKITNITNLPSPSEFGGGNPFLMFLCLTLLLQHRNTIIKSSMDYNEIAMHFDKMVRKHDVTRVLNQARRMYIDYLKSQNALNSSNKNNNYTTASSNQINPTKP